jgi:hypothetical protein
MDAYDGLLTFYPTANLLLNKSFVTGNELDRLPTTEKIIGSTLIASNDGSGILPYRSVLNLYGDGCHIDHFNETRPNCTAACAEPMFLFQDWQTEWNCLTLANMVVNKPYPHQFNDLNTIGDTSKALDLLAVTNLTGFDATGVLKRFYDCANSGWHNMEPDDNLFDQLYPEDHLNIHKWGVYLSSVCTTSPLEIDADLAGPGVSHMLSFRICFISSC